ncbi:hypothetical protein [Celerinatantimonas diazotrophica]|uniref:Uncharacterized protein n=1 Tax=Celerinatantimonas diazotrophica TaxID=412034 RepID=A0A4R1K474_9GAMM|nr:hypothetical protein [Celerinatantimonas diazotrophica]TCK58925.1 hypothetical protein EV690_1083 [Celerinatantimonas diazotrophica]CAG9297558.1 hypothetical protein CEDIAZO_02746 [Celerinatantimonas diazotrophica]
MDEPPINNSTPKAAINQPLTKTFSWYLKTIDWAFSHFIALIFKGIFFLTLIAISLASIVLEFRYIFEYNAGLADLSFVEIIFFVVLLILLKRYWVYSKQTSVHWWDLLTAPLLWYAKFNIFTFLSLFLILLKLESDTHLSNLLFTQWQHYEQIVFFIGTLISLYIAVPSRSLIIKLTRQNHRTN